MEEGNRAELERNRHEAFAGVVQGGIIRRRDDDIPRTKVRIRFVTVVSADKFFNAGTRADRAVGFRTKVTKNEKDKIRPVLQRSKLRSCTFLIVEQTNLIYFYIYKKK